MKRFNYIRRLESLNDIKLEALRRLRQVNNDSDFPVWLDSKPWSSSCVMFTVRTRTRTVDLGWCGWSQSPELYATLQAECVRLRNMRQLAMGRRSA